MARGIGWLAKDLKREIEKARADAGPIIINSLVTQGPYWTGTFGRKWALSGQPLKPTEKREGDWRDTDIFPGSRSEVKPAIALKLPLDSPLYIGNTVEYAGFAVNNPAATIGGKTYADQRGRTSKGKNPDWFKVYTAHEENAEIFNDITKAFVALGKGFKPAV
jgi:hypothetical protein